MIEDWWWWDLFIFLVRWYVAADDSEADCKAIFFCLLHDLPEVEVEFEFGSEVVVVVDEVDELVPDRLDRTGTLAFGDGVGIEA